MEKYSEKWIRQKHSELEEKTRIRKDGDLYSLADINKHLNEYSGDLGWAIGESSILESNLREKDKIRKAWERRAFARAKSMLKNTADLDIRRAKWFVNKFGGGEQKPTQKDIDNFVHLRWPRLAKFYEELTENLEAQLKLLEDYKKVWFKMDDIYKVIGSNIKFERDKLRVFEPSSLPVKNTNENRLKIIRDALKKEKEK